MPDLLQRLERANRILGKVLDLMSAGDQLAITPDHLAAILTELLQVGECLQDRGVVPTHPAVDAAVRQYRGQLEELRALMPSLHARLLTERVRLEAERSHLENANSWVEISHTTR